MDLSYRYVLFQQHTAGKATMVCTRLSILTTVGWLFVNEAKTCCNISRTWKHIFLSGSVTRQDFRRPTPNDLGIDKIAGFSCRVTANPTGISLPITDMKTAVLHSQSCQDQKLTKTEIRQKKYKTLGLSLALLGTSFCVCNSWQGEWLESDCILSNGLLRRDGEGTRGEADQGERIGNEHNGHGWPSP